MATAQVVAARATSEACSTPLMESAPGLSPSAGSRGGRLRGKRSLPSSLSPTDSAATATDGLENRRKTHKVSRACDFCKAKKSRCSGNQPCDTCVKKALVCVYDAKYSRGRPPTPPRAVPSMPATASSHIQDQPEQSRVSGDIGRQAQQVGAVGLARSDFRASPPAYDTVPPSRSPELDTSEIEGQFFEPKSGLAFLHEASKRLLAHRRAFIPHTLTGGERSQPLLTAGDPPYVAQPETSPKLPPNQVARDLVNFYFDVCVVTYRMLHRQSVVSWTEALLANSHRNLPLTNEIGHARASIVLTIFAIVSFRQERIRAWTPDQINVQAESDRYFCAALCLTDGETGFPGLCSAQARLLQVIYLLQTSRTNQAWYQFGITSQIVAALGLHRRSGRKRNGPLNASRSDYIDLECGKRTFWVAYIIDSVLSVVFGRPRHYHDEDIDQSFPDSINDESMTPHGPSGPESLEECHVDALILHAKIAQIIGVISRDVYSAKHRPKRERIAAAHQALIELHQWRSSLPPHLGTIKPSSLVPSFHREAIAMKLAYSHAIIHASRPFLLGHWGDTPSEIESVREAVAECIAAATVVLKTCDGIVADRSLFNAFWWMHYVAFCALAVVYILDVQQSAASERHMPTSGQTLPPHLLDLAERCRGHLSSVTAANTPSWRYSIVLEGLRHKSRQQQSHSRPLPDDSGQFIESEYTNGAINAAGGSAGSGENSHIDGQRIGIPGNDTAEFGGVDVDVLLSGWQATDWLDLDSSALAPFTQFDMDAFLDTYEEISTIGATQ